MAVTIKKWGNSAAVRIPAHVLDKAHLAVEQEVSLRVENHRIIIEPTTPTFTLEDLVAGITDENRHDEFDWGQAVGKEIW